MSAWSDWKVGAITDEEYRRYSRYEHERDNEDPFDDDYGYEEDNEEED